MEREINRATRPRAAFPFPALFSFSTPRPPFLSALHNNPCKTKIKPSCIWVLIHPQRPEPNLKEASRSLSSLHSRDRPRPHFRGRRRRGRSYTLVISSSVVVRPKLSPTVPASTFEILRACDREICESRCCCQRHRTVVGLGNSAGSTDSINVCVSHSTPPTHALLGLVDLYLTIRWSTGAQLCHSAVIRLESYPRSEQPLSDSQSHSKTRKHRASPDQADVCPEHALQVLWKQTHGLDDGLA